MEGQKIIGWQYYKHAIIPTTAPHEKPDLTPVMSGAIWKENKPLLVRWTSEWDCGYDTGWWYVIREGPFNLSELSASSRRNIRKALRNCRVEKIDPELYIDDLWRVFNEAIIRYRNYEMPFDKDVFVRDWICSGKDFWAGYDNTGQMIGFAVFEVHEKWVDYQVAKYSVQYLKLRVGDAINATVLDYYLNKRGKKYVSDGERSILHKTNVQKYLMEHFDYRKAYCRLHVLFRKRLQVLIKLLFPIRKLLRCLDGIQRVHKINSLLIMEEIVRLDMGSMDET